MTLTDRILTSRMLAALTSPHGIDRYLEQINPLWAANDVRARIVSVTAEAPGVATVTLQPSSTWRGHRAGQYVQVGVELPGSSKRFTRCFSISSAASMPGERFTLTVRAHEEGCVSKFMVRDAAPGQILHLGQAEGEFCLPGSPATPSPYPLLMISGGSGITPLMSQIRTLLRDGYDARANRKVTFVHFARSPRDQIFADELQRIAAADNDIEVHTLYGEDFSAIGLARIMPRFREVDTWACGPGPMIELIQNAYNGSDMLRIEFFKPPSVVSGTAEGEVTFAGRNDRLQLRGLLARAGRGTRAQA